MTTAATAPRAEGTRPGRNASDPRHFRWRDWRDIGWRVVADVGGDHLSVIAAGIAFFAMLALFPAMAALISLYGFFANTADVAAHLSYLQPFLPPPPPPPPPQPAAAIMPMSAPILESRTLFIIISPKFRGWRNCYNRALYRQYHK